MQELLPENKWKVKSLQSALNFFFPKDQIWHSQAEDIWHFYVLIMKLVFFLVSSSSKIYNLAFANLWTELTKPKTD